MPNVKIQIILRPPNYVQPPGEGFHASDSIRAVRLPQAEEA